MMGWWSGGEANGALCGSQNRADVRKSGGRGERRDADMDLSFRLVCFFLEEGVERSQGAEEIIRLAGGE